MSSIYLTPIMPDGMARNLSCDFAILPISAHVVDQVGVFYALVMLLIRQPFLPQSVPL